MKTQIGEKVVGIISTLIDERNAVGFDKYKETMDDVPFENYDWQQMVIEELLDGMQYMVKENERLRQQAKELEDKIGNGDGVMKLNEYQFLSQRTMPKMVDVGGGMWYSKMSKSNYALGLNGEAGELGEIVKKNVHHGHEFNRDEFVKEAGDVMHYIAGLCTMYDVTLEEVCTMNLFKLNKRYSNGFSTEDSIKRVDV